MQPLTQARPVPRPVYHRRLTWHSEPLNLKAKIGRTDVDQLAQTLLARLRDTLGQA